MALKQLLLPDLQFNSVFFFAISLYSFASISSLITFLIQFSLSSDVSHRCFFFLHNPNRRSQRRAAERADGYRAEDYHFLVGGQCGLQSDTIHPGVGHVRIDLRVGGPQHRPIRCNNSSDELFRLL